MILTWLLHAALALPPDGLAALLPVGSGALESLGTSWDGDVVYGVDPGTGQAFVLHVEDWSVSLVDACTARSATWIGYEDGWGELWVGCDDGLVRGLEWDPDAGTLSHFVNEDGSDFTMDLTASVDGLWFSNESGLLYGLESSSGAPVMHAADPFYGTVDGGSYPLNVSYSSGFAEGVLLADERTLVIHHGGRDMTTLDVVTASLASSTQFGGTFTPVDIHPSFTGGVYGASDSIGAIGEYIGQNWAVLMSGLNEPNAVVADLYSTDPWIAVTGGDVRVWRLDSTTGAIDGTADTPYYQSNPGDVGQSQNWIQDGVASDGYLWGGGTSGNLHVATARPWVEPSTTSITPASGTDGDELTVTFTVDEVVDWEIQIGGDRDGGGEVLASGSTAGAESVQQVVTVGADWAEGTNHIYVIVTDNQNLTGHARVDAFVDNPPGAVTLAKGDLEFADRALTLAISGVEDEDLDHYLVYVTTTPFDEADWPDGGPEYDGTTRLITPISVTAEGGARVTVDIKPLTNDIKHYVAVRAVDQGGLVGPMSNVISETPRPALSAADLAGEEGGGPGCATAPGTAGWLAIGLAGLAALRRRRGTLAMTALTAACLVLPGAAQAQDSGKKKGLEKDMTKQRGDFELRYGGITLNDANIKEVYDEGQDNILQLEFGPQFGRIIEIDVGMGFFQELSHKVDASGRHSSETTMLTWWPALALDGTARLHIIDEQLVVPYIRGGFDYVVWSEKWDSGSSKDIVRGSKFGNHFGVGGSLLLDVFDKGRASLLEAQTGINDTYLTFEWRRQQIDGRELPWAPAKKKGLDFGGTMFTVGLKLDY